MENDTVISLPTNSKKMNFPYRNNASSLTHVSAVSSALFSPGALVLCYFCVRMFNTTSYFCEYFFLVVPKVMVFLITSTYVSLYALKHKLYKPMVLPVTVTV